ncbi:PE domain-containing protein [Mycolicibacterium vaccae]|uniref:PE domain-containing protein n=1 Tax=Mycolicibacterium vaccae TaxID=1810 RepID=UPI003D0851A4
MGEPPPLKVDPSALTWDPAVVDVPPVPLIPPGGDPMSALISAVLPGIAADLNANVAATHAREQRFAANLNQARAAYQSTDDSGGEEIRTVADTQLAPSATTATSAPAAGGAGAQGQLGQFMSTAMQIGGQAVQAPAQLAGMMASAPQAVMQGAQGAVQQISQAAGQSEGSEGVASAPSVDQLGGVPEVDTADVTEDEQEPRDEEGAEAGASASERAPESLPAHAEDRSDPIEL